MTTLYNNLEKMPEKTPEKPRPDQVNIRLEPDLNSWLNNTVWKTKRLHGIKLPKEQIVEASLEHLRYRNLDWSMISSKELLLEALNLGKFNLPPTTTTDQTDNPIDKIEGDQ